MNETFSKAWQVDLATNKFIPGHMEWLVWIGQPLLYDGGLCVNRTPEEHQYSHKKLGSLIV